jgi:hypothetical protein
MTCPICEQKARNCDCSEKEKQLYSELEEANSRSACLDEKQARLLAVDKRLVHLAEEMLEQQIIWALAVVDNAMKHQLYEKTYIALYEERELRKSILVVIRASIERELDRHKPALLETAKNITTKHMLRLCAEHTCGCPNAK